MSMPSPDQITELKRHKANNLPDHEVGKIMGVSQHVIYRWRERLGMTKSRFVVRAVPAGHVASDHEADEPAIVIPPGDPLGAALQRYYAQRRAAGPAAPTATGAGA